MGVQLKSLVVLVKGGGEVASAVAHKLFRSRLRVCMTEIPRPVAVSRGVSFCEAIYDGEKEVEGVVARLINSTQDIPKTWSENRLPIIVDPQAAIRNSLRPDVIVDAIMAKKNLSTGISDAPLVIGLGPGFYNGRDVHMIVETNNTENLGRVITDGEAEQDTRVPLDIDGYTEERVLRCPAGGLFHSAMEIGDPVAAGDTVALVDDHPVKAQIDGVLRALLRDGVEVDKMVKLGEIDPTGERWVCFAIRAKMRTIAGGVLEAIMMRFNV